MGITKYNKLGRLALPIEAMVHFGLKGNDRLPITVSVASRRIMFRPTQEEPEAIDSAAAMKRLLEQMRRQPADERRYIRRWTTGGASCCLGLCASC